MTWTVAFGPGGALLHDRMAGWPERCQPAWTNRAALARAARVAPNDALGNDLSALLADVSAAAQYAHDLNPADIQGAAETDVSVTTDMQAVSRDCFG